MVDSVNFIDFDNIMSSTALEFAGDEQFNPNGIYSDKYAQVIINAGYNTVIAFHWADRFNTHLDEMAQIIINNKDFLYALEWTKFIGTNNHQMFDMVCNSFTPNVKDNYCYVMSEWFQADTFDKVNIKRHVIKNKCVTLFLDHLWNNWADYSLDDFYSDLPLEARIGVLI